MMSRLALECAVVLLVMVLGGLVFAEPRGSGRQVPDAHESNN
jgi:hypothetical protein